MVDAPTSKNKTDRGYLSFERKNLPKANRFTTHVFLKQDGSALVIGISLLPLLIGIMLATTGFAWFISAKNDLLYTCEKGVLQSQKILVDAENSLVRLNLPIKNLVMQKRFLKKALMHSKTPYEIAIIEARLLTIEIQLALLRKKQTAIHTIANMHASRTLQATALRMKQQLYSVQNLWSWHLLATAFAAPALIQMQKIKIDSSAVIYQANADFSQRQTLTATGKLSGSSLFPKWLQFLYDEHFSWQESCSSRPHLKENSTWTSELGKGKF